MALKIKDIKINDYERVIRATNESTKLDCVIAIHNTKLGPALGGVRSWEYRNFEDQKKDTLKLSEAILDMKNTILIIRIRKNIGCSIDTIRNILPIQIRELSHEKILSLLSRSKSTEGGYFSHALI